MNEIKPITLDYATVEGNTYKCSCGYRKEVDPTYPQREEDIIKASEHICSGFKVVIKFNHELKSCWMFNDPCGVVYEKDKWTEPLDKSGPLAVFERKGDAINFMNHMSLYGFQLWKCKFIRSERRELYGLRSRVGRVGAFGTLLIKLEALLCPDGTAFADKVKIIERVAKDET